jgi:hypothetical protein
VTDNVKRDKAKQKPALVNPLGAARDMASSGVSFPFFAYDHDLLLEKLWKFGAIPLIYF